MTVEEYVVDKLKSKPHAPKAEKLAGEPEKPKCTHCKCTLINDPNIMQYFYSSHRLCEKCYFEIENFEQSLGPMKYDDFDKWNLLNDKYPLIFERDFYKRSDVRKLLRLPELKKQFKWPWTK